MLTSYFYLVTLEQDNMNKTSNWWYLAPVFLGLLGGFIMFLVLRKEDNETAKTGLVIGIIVQVVGIFVGVVFWFVEMRALA